MLEALGNIGDFVGGLAVVVTLVYLAMQIRQNSRQMEFNTTAVKSAAYQAQLETTRLSNMEMVRDRKLAEWSIITREELEQLDPVDRVRFDLWWMGALRHRQHLFVQAQDGLIRSDLVTTHDAGARGIFSNPGVRDLWQRRKGQFIPDFVEHMDRLVAEPSTPSDSRPLPSPPPPDQAMKTDVE